MLSRSMRFFSSHSARDVLASFQQFKYYYPMLNAGFNSIFVADQPVNNIKACERLFTLAHGVQAFEQLRDIGPTWLSGTPEGIASRVAEELAQFPKDHEEGKEAYAEAIKQAGSMHSCKL